MATEIHPTAVVDPDAMLDEGVRVGPRAMIGPEVEIGADSEIGAGATVLGPTRMGRENRVFPQACVGFEPQDLKFDGERVTLRVGDRNIFRECCTIHRGTGAGGGETTIGSDNLFMVYCHVAHDCHIGNRTIFTNNATLAGHVEVGDNAVIGAFSAVLQFCRIGQFAYIGGYSILTKDVMPFTRVVGAKPVCLGINRVGLSRKGVEEEEIRRLQKALRLLTRSKLNTSQAMDQISRQLGSSDLVDDLISFIESSERGVIRRLPGKGGARGGASD